MGYLNPGFYFIPTKWLAGLRRQQMDRVQRPSQCYHGSGAVYASGGGAGMVLGPEEGKYSQKVGIKVSNSVLIVFQRLL